MLYNNVLSVVRQSSRLQALNAVPAIEPSSFVLVKACRPLAGRSAAEPGLLSLMLFANHEGAGHGLVWQMWPSMSACWLHPHFVAGQQTFISLVTCHS